MKRKREEIRLRNLELLVAQAGSAVTLARRAQTSASYLSQIRRGLHTASGASRSMGDALAHKLERAMGKPEGWMDEPHPLDDRQLRGARHDRALPPVHAALHPLLSWATAGRAAANTESPADDDAGERLLCPVPCSEETFVLRVQGDSMEPRFHDGELIYVDPEVTPTSGRYVVVRHGDSGEAILRRLVVEGGQRYLEALNPDWPDRIEEASENVTICGVVVFRGDAT